MLKCFGMKYVLDIYKISSYARNMNMNNLYHTPALVCIVNLYSVFMGMAQKCVGIWRQMTASSPQNQILSIDKKFCLCNRYAVDRIYKIVSASIAEQPSPVLGFGFTKCANRRLVMRWKCTPLNTIECIDAFSNILFNIIPPCALTEMKKQCQQ